MPRFDAHIKSRVIQLVEFSASFIIFCFNNFYKSFRDIKNDLKFGEFKIGWSTFQLVSPIFLFYRSYPVFPKIGLTKSEKSRIQNIKLVGFEPRMLKIFFRSKSQMFDKSTKCIPTNFNMQSAKPEPESNQSLDAAVISATGWS